MLIPSTCYAHRTGGKTIKWRRACFQWKHLLGIFICKKKNWCFYQELLETLLTCWNSGIIQKREYCVLFFTLPSSLQKGFSSLWTKFSLGNFNLRSYNSVVKCVHLWSECCKPQEGAVVKCYTVSDHLFWIFYSITGKISHFKQVFKSKC